MDTEPLFYGVKRAAKIIGIGETLLREQINAGRFPATRIGSRILVSRLYLEKLARSSDNAPEGGYSDGTESTQQ